MTNEEAYRQGWMTDDQWFCSKFLAKYFFGWHHMPGKIKIFGDGIEINFYPARMGTFDFDGMTLLVLMAHEECVRVSIEGSGPQLIKMVLSRRHSREGRMFERHPTISDAIAAFRKHYKKLPVREGEE